MRPLVLNYTQLIKQSLTKISPENHVVANRWTQQAPKTALYFVPIHDPDQCLPKCLILLPGPTSGETWAGQKSELVCLDLTKNCSASLILGWARFCSLKLDLDWVCVEV